MVLDRSRTPAILDIEASGFGKGSYPIEIGVATQDGECFSWLVKPERDWTHWQAEAEALHGISREEIQLQGQTPLVIAEEMNAKFEGQTLYSDGWGFDSGWLALLFYVAGKNTLFKLETLPRILSPYQLETWDAAKAELRMKHGLVHHRAKDDARLIQLTYQKTLIDDQLT